jgi:hypothetical protein
MGWPQSAQHRPEGCAERKESRSGRGERFSFATDLVLDFSAMISALTCSTHAIVGSNSIPQTFRMAEWMTTALQRPSDASLIMYMAE